MGRPGGDHNPGGTPPVAMKILEQRRVTSRESHRSETQGRNLGRK